MTPATYLVALGSNRRGRHGGPSQEVQAALATMGGVLAASPVIESAPIGPSIRRFANAAALIASDDAPPVFLARLKAIERDFGRRRGRRWGARVVDLDIILWSGGAWRSKGLAIPHAAFRTRRFVLAPAAAVARDWRDPVSGRAVRHLLATVDRRAPLT